MWVFEGGLNPVVGRIKYESGGVSIFLPFLGKLIMTIFFFQLHPLIVFIHQLIPAHLFGFMFKRPKNMVLRTG